MDHSLPVSVLDGLGNLDDQSGGFARWEWAGDKLLCETVPIDETHAEIVLSVVLADLVDRHDPGMIEVGGGLGLRVEPLDVGVVSKMSRQDHLERDGPIEAHLPCLEDHAHAAAASSRMIS